MQGWKKIFGGLAILTGMVGVLITIWSEERAPDLVIKIFLTFMVLWLVTSLIKYEPVKPITDIHALAEAQHALNERQAQMVVHRGGGGVHQKEPIPRPPSPVTGVQHVTDADFESGPVMDTPEPDPVTVPLPTEESPEIQWVPDPAPTQENPEEATGNGAWVPTDEDGLSKGFSQQPGPVGNDFVVGPDSPRPDPRVMPAFPGSQGFQRPGREG